MTHPGVGPITALAFVLVIGSPERFSCGKQVGSYLGLIPCEESSSEHWRLGHISKQGNKLLRFLLGQSAQSVARCEESWHRQYAHLSMRRVESSGVSEKRITLIFFIRPKITKPRCSPLGLSVLASFKKSCPSATLRFRSRRNQAEMSSHKR